MKTPDEIEKWMEYCWSVKPCADCAYDKRDFPHCVRRLLGDALDGYRQLAEDECKCEIEATLLKDRLAQVERERDALMQDLRTAIRDGSVCTACRNDIGMDARCEANNFDCNNCANPCKCKQCDNDSNWEWRGVCPENVKEDATDD